MLKKIKTLTKVTKNWVQDKTEKLPKNYKSLTMCERCYAFKYRNSWHFKQPEYLTSEQEVPVIFTQCTACLEQENALFENESELVLSSRLG